MAPNLSFWGVCGKKNRVYSRIETTCLGDEWSCCRICNWQNIKDWCDWYLQISIHRMVWNLPLGVLFLLGLSSVGIVVYPRSKENTAASSREHKHFNPQVCLSRNRVPQTPMVYHHLSHMKTSKYRRGMPQIWTTNFGEKVPAWNTLGASNVATHSHVQSQ